MVLRSKFLTLVGDQPERGAAFKQQSLVFARQAAPLTQRLEAVAMPVLVDQGGERADLLDSVAWRHEHAAFGAQPAPIVQTVLGNEAQIGGDEILEPAIHPLGGKVVGVGMLDRNVQRAQHAVGAVGDAYSANVPLPCGPSAAAISRKRDIVRLDIECSDA